MIDKKYIGQILENFLHEKGLFLVEVKVSKGNDIDVTVDSLEKSIELDDCVSISRHIESLLDRDKEDFSLTVGSAGLTMPFKVPLQYTKHIGSEVEVSLKGGRKLTGVLKSFNGESIELYHNQSCEKLTLSEINKTKLKI